MAFEPALVIQVPRGSRVGRALEADPPSALADGHVIVETGATDPEGNLEASAGGEVVYSVPSPAAFSRDPNGLHRVLDEAGTGDEPLVVVVEAAEELTDPDLRLLLDAAARARRPVILRIVRDG